MAVHSARSYHMGGANPVSVSEVLAYTQLVGIASALERVKYLRIVQRLDTVYLNYQAEKAAKTKP